MYNVEHFARKEPKDAFMERRKHLFSYQQYSISKKVTYAVYKNDYNVSLDILDSSEVHRILCFVMVVHIQY